MPLNAPRSIDTTTHARNATIIGAWSVAGLTSPPQRTLRTTLPATAIVAPTLISCPPEADVTSVMPIASIASSEALSSIVMMLPEITISPALFGAYLIAKNEGSAIRLNSTSISSAASGIKI